LNALSFFFGGKGNNGKIGDDAPVVPLLLVDVVVLSAVNERLKSRKYFSLNPKIKGLRKIKFESRKNASASVNLPFLFSSSKNVICF
jgi:hypothetical protein